MVKAIFLDRDGVVNSLIYHKEKGIIDSPMTEKQFDILPGVCEAVNMFHNLNYKVVLVSNQPGIAKGKMSEDSFRQIKKKMEKQLASGGAFLDGEYYCLHHPEAIVEDLRINCDCRKPKPGLFFDASVDLDIDLYRSWMIGDNLTDIKAGKAAGTNTMLLGKMKCELCHLMEEENVRPDVIIDKLKDVVQIILKEEVIYAQRAR